jgi:hypothetical protein
MLRTTFLLPILAVVLAAGPVHAGPFTQHPEPLVAEMEERLADDFVEPLTALQKQQYKALEGALAAFASAPSTTWGDLRALRRAVRKLRAAFGEEFSSEFSGFSGVSLEHLAWEVLDGLDADVAEAADAVRYLAPTLGPAALSNVVTRRANHATNVLARAHGSDDLLTRARRLGHAAHIVERAEAMAAKTTGEVPHFVFGSAFAEPLEATKTYASHESGSGRLILSGWVESPVPGGSTLHLTIVMDGVHGVGAYPFYGPEWVSAYVETSSDAGFVRMDALEGQGKLVVEELNLQAGRIQARFSFPAYDSQTGASLSVDHGSLRSYALQAY